MWVLGGIDTNDAPILEAVQNKMEADINNSRKAILPEGSNYKSSASSLADLQTILTPFERSIASESGVPMWLLFPQIVSSSFDLESRSIWATSLFEQLVIPVLADLLTAQGYTPTEIIPPSYRDALTISEVAMNLSDVEYKKSASQINRIQATTGLSGLMLGGEDTTTTSGAKQDKPVEVKARRGRKL